MSSTSRPQTTGTSNVQPGQSPSKTPQVESTNPTPNVAQPLYQNNPNQQFIPNNMPLINPAQQLQIQSQLTNLHQTAAFLQRQSQFLQQPNAVESTIKNQPLSNGQMSFPDLLNFFLRSNSNLNLPLSQLNPSQTPVQQLPLQTPKTVPVSPSKSGALQHTPRSATTGPRSVSASNINNAQTAEVNSATTPSPTVSAQNTEISKQLLTPSPIKSSSVSAVSTVSSVSTVSTVSTPSSTISVRLLEEVKERKNILLQATSKNSHDDNTLSINTSPTNQDVSSPEASKSALPRRKQTSNVAATATIKANPIISPSSNPTISPSSNPTVERDSMAFSTPKKPEDVKSSSNSPSTPLTNVSKVPVPSTAPTTPTTPPEKKVKPTKKEVSVQKSAKKNEVELKRPSVTNLQKQPTSSAQVAPKPAPIELEIKSKRNRFKTNLYQSPTPELVLATRMSVSEANKNSVSTKDKLIIFFADEFIAVRNDEGTFYLCQCSHNMYKSSKKCRVRWLNKDDNSADTYKLTFYDYIDKECILTSVSMDNVADSYKLTDTERERIENILKKSIDVEKGLLPRPEVTEENPDGLDISLYNDESQIKSEETVGQKRKSESSAKLTSPSKKVKKDTKTSKDPPPSRRSANSSSVETPKKNRKSSKQSKATVQRRSNDLKHVESSSSPSDESNSDAGKKKVAKTKPPRKSTASTASPSSPGSERTLRNRRGN